MVGNKTESPNEKEKEPYKQVKKDETNLTLEQLVQVKALLKPKAQAFATKDAAPSKANNVTHTIDTGNHKLIHVHSTLVNPDSQSRKNSSPDQNPD
jgi:hypothetical protein